MAGRHNNRITESTRQRLREQLAAGADDTNPSYLFSTTSTTLLLAITGGLVDPLLLAREQLANRGLDANGDWCGFDRAREIHLGAKAVDSTNPEADTSAEQTTAEIARRVLHLDTIETQNSDSLDFHEIAIWQIKEALTAAFAAGQAVAK